MTMTATAALLETISPPSRRIADKALHLPTRPEPDGSVTVGSGSEPGVVYHVTIPDGAGNDPNAWICDCVGPAGCSHAWAALAACSPVARRLLRKTAAAPVAPTSEPSPPMPAPTNNDPTKERTTFGAVIAPTQSALRRHGGDGGFSVALNGTDSDVSAYFALCLMTNHPLKVTIERQAKTTFGRRASSED